MCKHPLQVTAFQLPPSFQSPVLARDTDHQLHQCFLWQHAWWSADEINFLTRCFQNQVPSVCSLPEFLSTLYTSKLWPPMTAAEVLRSSPQVWKPAANILKYPAPYDWHFGLQLYYSRTAVTMMPTGRGRGAGSRTYLTRSLSRLIVGFWHQCIAFWMKFWGTGQIISITCEEHQP